MRRCRAEKYENGKRVPVEGMFHQWASEYEDCGEAGIANGTVALVELDNGYVVECIPDTVVFEMPAMIGYRKMAKKLEELDRLSLSIQKVSGYTVEQLLKMFLAGYEMKRSGPAGEEKKTGRSGTEIDE